MKATRQQAPPRVANISRSVEVQHGMRGLGRMLRRGMHGAKNWVLEPEEDGTPRSAGAKFLRTVVVLAPLLLVLSAVTGGPERGGHQTSVWQALLGSLVLTLGGLSFLSARERRLGREEPWADLPDLGTDRDAAGSSTKVMPSSETPTQPLENVQVSEVSTEDDVDFGVVTRGDIPDVSDQTPQTGPLVDTAGVDTPFVGEVSPDPFAQVGAGDQGCDSVTEVLDTRMNKTGIPDALEEETPTVPLTPGNRPRQPVTVSLSKDPFSQVNEMEGVATQGLPGVDSPVTGSDDPLISPRVVWPVAGEAVTSVQGELFPQVTAVTTPLVTATPGPYPVEDTPVADDWFLTKPDVETADEAENKTDVEAEDIPVEDAEREVDEDAMTQEEPGGAALLDLHPAVMRYRAIRSMPDATEEMRERARAAAAQWAREEIEAGRRSQRSAARELGVTKTTVAKWLDRDDDFEPGPDYDPWAEVEGN